MRLILFIAFFAITVLPENVNAQGFPSPASLSTGQGTPGTLDPIWTVSDWFLSPPNPIGLTYTPALINNNCAPGAWVNPATLPPPVNNGNWITNANYPCASNYNYGYIVFRLPINLPTSCDGRSISSTGSYTLSLSGYVDNGITDVYVNGTSTGLSGGGFTPGSQLNMTLTGPWVGGLNYIDVVVYNTYNNGNQNPYGLLLVANAAAIDTADSDHDGMLDVTDQCPCLSGNRANGCPPPVVGDTVICRGDTTILRASELGAGYSYTWSNGATADSVIVYPTANTVYGLTVTGANNFRDSGTVTIHVNPLPVPTISPANPAICPGGSITLTAGGGTGYHWSTPANTAATTVSPAGTAPYTVTVTDVNGCSTTASRTVTVYTLPSPVISPDPSQICIGKNELLTASGGVSYLWGNNATTDTLRVSPTTGTTYSVTVTDAHTCSAATSTTVTVNALPTPTITPAPAAICFGTSSLLTATGGTGYLWSNTATTDTTTVSPTTTTTYSITVTDANGCSAVASQSITVNQLPVAVISPAVVQICVGNDTTLTASGGTSYVWSTTAVGSSILVSPTSTTTYSVVVTDANSCTATTSRSVTVNALPTPSITPSAVAICIGASTTLTGSGGTNYLWSTTGSGASANVSPTATTTYTMTATDANTCSAATTATVTVNPLPAAAIAPVADICLGASANLIASGGNAYLWSNSAITATIVVAPSITTTYSVSVTDTNLCVNTASATVTVITPMALTPTITNVSCNGGNDGVISVSVSNGLSPYSYLWSTSGSTSSTITGLTMGSYPVAVTDFAGCSVTASYNVTEPAALSLTSSFIDPTCSTIDYNGSITLNVSGGTSPYQFIWSDNSTDQSPINLTIGNYLVTVTDANSCSTRSSFALTYIYDFAVHANPSDSINLGDTAVLGYTMSGTVGNFTNLWSPSSTLSCTDCVNPVAAPYHNSLYHILITNDQGCIATDSTEIYVIPNYDIYVPNSFTPNGDGTNDLFQIFGNFRSLKFVEIQVFNRWGEVVFKSDDLNFAWDGSYKGSLQEPGMFVWQLNLTFIDGHDLSKKGSLTLIR